MAGVYRYVRARQAYPNSTYQLEETMMRRLLTLCIALAAIVAVTASSFGGSMMLLGVGSPSAGGGGGGGPLSITWQSGIGTSTAPAAPWAPSAIACGTATADRIIVIVLTYLGSGANDHITTATINGTTGTLAVDGYTASGRRNVAIWYLPVSTGTTATLTFSGWTGGNVQNLAVNLATITGSVTALLGSSVTSQLYPIGGSAAVSVPTNGLAVLGYVAATAANAGSIAPIWSGGGVTDGFQLDASAGGNTGGAQGHLSSSATIAPTPNGGAGNYGGAQGWVSASFQP
jgi:hypothetical protein